MEVVFYLNYQEEYELLKNGYVHVLVLQFVQSYPSVQEKEPENY